VDKEKLQKLKDIDREIKNLDAAARKLKNMAEEMDLPIVFYNVNRILGTLNVLKENISEPLNIIYSD
jgi:hypothetical protein